MRVFGRHFRPPAHHVQAATVHQRSELMQTDLCGVQYSLDLLQTSLKMKNEQRQQAQLKNNLANIKKGGKKAFYECSFDQAVICVQLKRQI